jgi:hypothetical protein
MKKLVVVVISLISFYAATAQDNGVADFEKYLDKKVKAKMNTTGTTVPVQKMAASKTSATISNTPQYDKLPNGNVAYSLKQDHMPCVVPAPQNYSMPVAGNKQLLEKKAGKIPNLSTN